ncbi:MAG: SDR family NAD(P)-dependent oxidoreductase [Saprospiraceae bacterium]|nr:SDR family NAD(P)-dependent oxidoreductase [Saprospiraceae bacterium]
MKVKKNVVVKTALVTGATSGIGKATATIFAKHGYNVIITGRRKEKLKELSSYLTKKYGVDILELCFDIRHNDEVTKALQGLKKSWTNIDVLVNNAGLARGLHPIHEGRLDDWETMIDTNIKGLLYITRLVSPMMVAAGKGHIINVCSTAGHETYPNGNVYSATKFAVDALTKSMRVDLYKHGIKVGQVSPGHVEETEFALVRFDKDTQKSKIYEDFTPLKAKDVAEVIYYMASRPKHVNIQDILLMSSQQAGSNFIDRSGRK